MGRTVKTAMQLEDSTEDLELSQSGVRSVNKKFKELNINRMSSLPIIWYLLNKHRVGLLSFYSVSTTILVVFKG